MRLQDVILRGLAAARPAAGDVPIGTLYYASDTNVTTRNNGTTWDSYTDASSGDGDKGDITVSSAGTVWTIDNDAVTYAKIQNVSATDRVLLRDTAGAGDIEEGQVGSGIEFTGGPGLRLTTAARTRAITVYIGDGTNVITTGVKGYIQCPYTGTITKVALVVSDASFTSGSIVVDIWKDTFANRPPTVADTITAAAKPTLSGATGSEDSTLTGWTTSVTAGDVLGFNVDSVATVKQVMLQLTIVVAG